jgi:RsiW-degrading membrane proteinase PrsW (M82 family)
MFVVFIWLQCFSAVVYLVLLGCSSPLLVVIRLNVFQFLLDGVIEEFIKVLIHKKIKRRC